MLLFPEEELVGTFYPESGTNLGFHEVVQKLFRRLSDDPKLRKLVGLTIETQKQCKFPHKVSTSSVLSVLQLDGSFGGRLEERIHAAFKEHSESCDSCLTKLSSTLVSKSLAGEPPVVFFIEIAEIRKPFPTGVERTLQLRFSDDFEKYEYEFVCFVKYNGKFWIQRRDYGFRPSSAKRG